MSLRLLGIIAEISFGTVLAAWGIATARRPALWTRRGARWWVGWTSAPVPRTHGLAMAVVGAGLLVCSVATALTAPAAPIPVLAQDLQLIGLGVVLLGGAVLAGTHPAPETPATTTPPPDRARSATASTTDTPPALAPAP